MTAGASASHLEVPLGGKNPRAGSVCMQNTER
jgi:hypothetical protein